MAGEWPALGKCWRVNVVLWEGHPPASGRVEADALMRWLDTQM